MHNSKLLTDAQQHQIAQLYEMTFSRQAIANIFDVGITTIERVIRGLGLTVNSNKGLPHLPREWFVLGSLFKLVPNTNGYLMCNEEGRFIGKQGHIVVPRKQSSGYLWYTFIKANGKYANMYAHRGVALTWLKNPENKRYVNHIDGNKYNNHVDNLEWCTCSENHRHAIDTGLLNNLPKKGQHGFQKTSNQTDACSNEGVGV